MHERGLARTGDSRHHGERVEGQAQGDVFQIVLARAHEDEMAPAPAAHERHGNRLTPGQVARGERAGRPAELLLGAAEHDLAAPLARPRPQLHDVVGRLDEAAIVLDDHHGVAELFLRPVEHDVAAALAGSGAQLDHVVGRLDERAVVLDDHHRVAGIGQLAAEIGQTRGVARVQADRRLVEHVERAHELRAELVGEVDALRLPAR